jgi:23S rRNA pseudouridine2457 synthase
MGRILPFSKPFGVICQFNLDGLHPALADYIPLPDYYPAGQSDTDSEDLLVLTDDGQLQHRNTAPNTGCLKPVGCKGKRRIESP